MLRAGAFPNNQKSADLEGVIGPGGAGADARRSTSRWESGGAAAPIHDFAKTVAMDVLEKPDAVPAVLELVDIGPDFGLPGALVGGGFPAGCAAGMQANRPGRWGGIGQLDEDAADFQNLVGRPDDVLVT